AARGSLSILGPAPPTILEFQNDTLVEETFCKVAGTLLRRLAWSPGSGGRVLVVSSASPQEGKTTISSCLAKAFAEMGRSTLLVDGDLKNPNIHARFDMPNTWGVTDLLSESTDVDSYPLLGLGRGSQVPNLWVLPSGPGAVKTSR